MPICQHCNEKWSWKQALTKSLKLMMGMTCPHCGERQYQTARMRRKSTLVPIIVVPLIAVGHHFIGRSSMFVIFLFALLLLGIAINPFMIELANEEEPPF